MKERIDILLVKKHLAESRTQAQARILAGEVVVNDHRVDKAGMLVSVDAIIRLKGKEQPFVSRGGLKLQKALECWPVVIQDAICLDVGASTGGFTDVLLQNGAQLVYALDVGYGQLHWSLRSNARVKNLERTHIGKLSPHFFAPEPSIATVDVSFISLLKVLPFLLQQLASPARIYLLIKPQFEVGRENIEKGGIVRNQAARSAAVEKVLQCAQSLECQIVGFQESPITGTDGNVEYICALNFNRA